MHDGALVLYRGIHRRFDAFFNGPDGRILADQARHFIGANFLQQGRNILIMVIKGIPIDPATVGNILYRDLSKRLLIENFHKGGLYCTFCDNSVCHCCFLLLQISPHFNFNSQMPRIL